MIAENGIAAHWRYKYLSKDENDQNMYSWLRDAVNYVEERNEKHLILNKTSQQFFDEQIYVFSPKGELYTLPVDSTPVDFAYTCLLYTSPSPRDLSTSRMPSSA